MAEEDDAMDLDGGADVVTGAPPAGSGPLDTPCTPLITFIPLVQTAEERLRATREHSKNALLSINGFEFQRSWLLFFMLGGKLKDVFPQESSFPVIWRQLREEGLGDVDFLPKNVSSPQHSFQFKHRSKADDEGEKSEDEQEDEQQPGGKKRERGELLNLSSDLFKDILHAYNFF